MNEPEIFDIVKAVNRLDQKVTALLEFVERRAQSPARQLALEYIESEPAARLLHVSLRTLAKMRAKGEVPFTKVGQKDCLQYRRPEKNP